MSKPAMIGTIGAYVEMTVTFKRRKVSYNGTTLGLVRSLLAVGAKDGDTFKDEQGRTRRIYAAPHDKRAGFWATSFNKEV